MNSQTPLRHFSLRGILEVVAILLLSIAVFLFLQSSDSTAPSGSTPGKPALQVTQNLQSDRYATNESIVTTFMGYQREKAFHGFTLYPESGTETLHLVNMNGLTVHQWKLDVARARLLPDCSVLVVHGSKWGLKRPPWSELRSTLRRYSWNGDIEWEHTGKGSPYHHDVSISSKDSVLAIQRTKVPHSIRSKLKNPALRDLSIRSDRLSEISTNGAEIWSWNFHDHLDINSCGRYQCQPLTDPVKAGKKEFDWSHVNSARFLPENKWFDSGDTRFRPGNILVTARNWSTILLIEKHSGNVVWRYSGDLFGGIQYGHDAYMIPANMPGAGNILMFDNGVARKQSVVLEVNPATKEVEWHFSRGESFFSAAAGSAQRLPNGNTLISEDLAGRIFEVSPAKEVVWLYEGRGIRSARATRYPQSTCPQLEKLPVH